MPSYDYKCSNCGHELEIFHSITEGGRKRCPKCKKQTLKRLISGGGGIIFRGEPFSWSTKYLKKNRKKKKGEG